MKKVIIRPHVFLLFMIICGLAHADGNSAGGRSGGGGGSRQDLKEWVDAEADDETTLDPARVERKAYCLEFTTAAMEGLQIISWLKDAGYPFSADDPRIPLTLGTQNFGIELDHYTLWLARVSILNLCRSGRFHINRLIVDEKNRPRVAYNHDREIEFNPDEWIPKEVVSHLACPKSGYLTPLALEACVRNVRRAIAVHEIFSIIPNPVESNKFYPVSALVVDLHVGKDHNCSEIRTAMWSHLRDRFANVKRESASLLPAAYPKAGQNYTEIVFNEEEDVPTTSAKIADPREAAVQFERNSQKLANFSRQLEILQIDAKLLEDVYGNVAEHGAVSGVALPSDISEYLRLVRDLDESAKPMAQANLPQRQ